MKALICVFFLSFLSISSCSTKSDLEFLPDKNAYKTELLGENAHHRIPKDMCKIILTKFSQTVADLTECQSRFARPIELCLRCRDEYLAVQRAFAYMKDFEQDNVTCSTVLMRQDRLGVIQEQYKWATGDRSLWEMASCSNCYEDNNPMNEKANHTTTFEILWNTTFQCFKKYYHFEMTPDNLLFNIRSDPAKGSLCQNCSEIYNLTRQFFWNTVVISSENSVLSGVCYDLRDRFNLTGIVWKETFHCEPQPNTWIMISIIVGATIAFAIFIYTCEPCILPIIFPSVTPERINLAVQDVYDGDAFEVTDENNEIQGNFEVLSGVTASEYIKRYIEVQVQTGDNTFHTIRVPPPPEVHYDLEWNNDTWVCPPREMIQNLAELKRKLKQEEISQQEYDILECRLMKETLRKKRAPIRRKKASGVSNRSMLNSAQEDVMMISETWTNEDVPSSSTWVDGDQNKEDLKKQE